MWYVAVVAAWEVAVDIEWFAATTSWMLSWSEASCVVNFGFGT